MKKKTALRALLMSTISLLLCVSMLVGTTFAWFTDSVTSANNIIKSGNLDVELYFQVENSDVWNKVGTNTNVFMDKALWEPGHTEVVKLKVVNEGSLALKYQLGVNVASETGSVNVKGEDFKLSDHIKFGIVEGAQTYTREEAVSAVDASADKLNTAWNSAVTKLEAKNDTDTDEKIVTMVVYMPTTVGNEANHAKDAAQPVIKLGINLFATQVEAEADSFNEFYDKDAPVVSSPVARPQRPEEGSESTTENVILNGLDDVTVELPGALVDELPVEVEELSLAVSAAVMNNDDNTITFPSIEVVDQDGNIIDLEELNTGIKFTVTIPAQTMFAPGETVMIYHDGEYIATAIVNDDTTITYQAEHLCEVTVGTTKVPVVDAEDENTIKISNVAELMGLAQSVNAGNDYKGKTIILTNDIDLKNVAWTPIGTNAHPLRANFDGNGKTISNLNVTNEGWAGLIGHAGLGSGVTISNVTIDGATILSNRMAGAVVGQVYGSIDNCHVKNATIIVTPNLVGDSYDNGDKVGGIVGWLGDNGNNRTLSNCTATNVALSAYRDVGGIVGYVASSTTVSGNSVAGLEITVDQTTNYYGDKDINAGAICGRVNGTITDANNTNSNVTINSTYSKDGLTLKSDNSGNVTLYLVPESYEGTTLTVPEGVTAIGNYAFAYNTNVETVILASTVRDLGRGFDSSTVKKVVLNEGLEVISSRAFRRTYSLEELVISSTVTTVEDNAFQSSGIKEIVFPESVNFIGDSCFTGASVEKVTIKGANVEIAHYAFRDCPNLSEVNILSESITLGSGMIFTNSQNNNANPNNITITVRNDDVKAAIVNNGTFKGVIVINDGFVKVESAEALLEVLANGGQAKLTADICVNDTIDLNGGTIDGNGKTITFTKSGSGAVLFNPTGGTIKNMTIVDPNANMFDSKYAIGSNQFSSTTLTQDLYIENVVISGFELAIDLNANGHSVYVKDSEVANWVQVANAEMTTFEGCHLYADAAAQQTYNQPSSKQAILFLMGDMTFTNCHFEEDVNFYLDSPRFSGNVYFNNSTYGNNGVENRPIESFGFIQWWFPATGVYGYAGTFGDGKPAQTHFNWYIDGVQVWDATAI